MKYCDPIMEPGDPLYLRAIACFFGKIASGTNIRPLSPGYARLASEELVGAANRLEQSQTVYENLYG